MNQLKVIERNNFRVLTSEQIAEVFGTEPSIITRNFNRNKDRYSEGKHYFCLTGEERREFLNQSQIDSSLKHAHTIYLWTEKGAFLHAKSLNTDAAWDAYTKLVDDYFQKVEQFQQPAQDVQSLSPLLQCLIQIETRQNAMEARQSAFENKQSLLEERTNEIDEVKQTVEAITETMTAIPDHTKVVSKVNEFARWTRLGHNEVYNNVYDILKKSHGIDVRQRVENERNRIQKEHNDKTGKWYSESTLKQKVNGIDIMVRLGCLDKFYTILTGLLAKEKVKSKLSLVK